MISVILEQIIYLPTYKSKGVLYFKHVKIFYLYTIQFLYLGPLYYEFNLCQI